MPRKARATTDINTPTALQPTAPAVEHDLTQSDAMGAIAQGLSEERDLANQLWGQIQMADAISKLTTVVGLSKLKEIKETKLYRAFAGKTAMDRNGSRIPDVGTWEGFCRAIGMSANKVDEDLLNIRTFGEEAMENLTRIGAGYRELRQYRRLPEDQKLALLEVAKSGDKDAFVEVAEEIIAKHAREKEELQGELASKEEVLAEKNKRLERMAKDNDDLAERVARVKVAKPDEALEDFRRELLGFHLEIESVLINKLRPAYQALAAHLEQQGLVPDDYIIGSLGQIETLVRDLHEEFIGANPADVAAWAKQA